jgi:hypothetical protein
MAAGIHPIERLWGDNRAGQKRADASSQVVFKRTIIRIRKKE